MIEYVTTYWIPISLLITIVAVFWFVLNRKGNFNFSWWGIIGGVIYIIALDFIFYGLGFTTDFMLWVVYLMYSLPLLASYLLTLLLSLFWRKPELKKVSMALFFATLSEGITAFAFLVFEIRPSNLLS